MTTELEEQFYKTFGIEPIPIKSYGYWLIKGSIAENDKGEKVVYPEITDRVLLELICVLNSVGYYNCGYEPMCLQGDNIQELRVQIIKDCIEINTKKMYGTIIKEKIQQLFKEEE